MSNKQNSADVEAVAVKCGGCGGSTLVYGDGSRRRCACGADVLTVGPGIVAKQRAEVVRYLIGRHLGACPVTGRPIARASVCVRVDDDGEPVDVYAAEVLGAVAEVAGVERVRVGEALAEVVEAA